MSKETREKILISQGNVIIKAGAGRGKTTLLSRKIRYDYENNIPDDAREKIYLSTNVKRAEHNFCFNTLRLIDGSEIKLLLLDDNGKQAVPGFSGINLISLIKESPDFNDQTDLDKENLYNLELTFDGVTLVSIGVNNWDKVMVKPEV